MVRRYIRQCEYLVASQKRTVAHLRTLGLDTTLARELLARFEDGLSLQRTHLEKLHGNTRPES